MYEFFIGMSLYILCICGVLAHHYYDLYKNPLDQEDPR